MAGGLKLIIKRRADFRDDLAHQWELSAFFDNGRPLFTHYRRTRDEVLTMAQLLSMPQQIGNRIEKLDVQVIQV